MYQHYQIWTKFRLTRYLIYIILFKKKNAQAEKTLQYILCTPPCIVAISNVTYKVQSFSRPILTQETQKKKKFNCFHNQKLHNKIKNDITLKWSVLCCKHVSFHTRWVNGKYNRYDTFLFWCSFYHSSYSYTSKHNQKWFLVIYTLIIKASDGKT